MRLRRLRWFKSPTLDDGAHGMVWFDKIPALSYTMAMKTRRPHTQSLALVLRRIKTRQEIPIEIVPLAALPKHVEKAGINGFRRRRPKGEPKSSTRPTKSR
jgi:hypothetical protein